MSKKVFVISHNHFDVSWRRCFDRKSSIAGADDGIELMSYASLEERVLSAFLDYKQSFWEGQVSVLRKYLEKNPSRVQELREAAKTGQFSCVMAGETVQDTNLSAPEGLIRNFLCVYPFYKSLVGEKHKALRICSDEDAFGGSPNYPQIVKGIGCDFLTRVSYTGPSGKIWQGLDGSRVAVLEQFYDECSHGTFEKHPPCGYCGGSGMAGKNICEACSGSGANYPEGLGFERLCAGLENAINCESEVSAFFVGGEEFLPEKELAAAVDFVSQKHKDVTVRFGSLADILENIENEAAYALENDSCSCEDLNPVFQGCYTSRIKIKQKVRELTYRLCTVESSLAQSGFAAGKTTLYPENLRLAWQKISFCQFHDIITGTNTDSAHSEAMDLLCEAENIISLFENNQVRKNESPFINSYKTKCSSVNWGKNVIDFDDFGILRITADSREIFTTKPYGRYRRPLRIAELVIEPDAGDAWATRIVTFFNPEANQTMVPLGDYQKLIYSDENTVIWQGKFPKSDYMIKTLQWKITMTNNNGCPDFHIEVDWDTFSRKLKVLLPLKLSADDEQFSAVYEVPFGHFTRKYVREKVDFSSWSPNYMEYPAQNWVMKEMQCGSVAVILKTIPGVRWLPGCFELNLLRSPQFHFVGNEAQNYDFNDFDGLRDSGKHCFDFMLLSSVEKLNTYELSRRGYKYNSPEALSLPFKLSGEVIPTAFKISDESDGYILRFYNPQNKDVDFEISDFAPYSILECDMLERNCGRAEATINTYKDTLTAFKIRTLKFIL